MASTFPLIYASPEPLNYLPGEDIKAQQILDLIEAQHHLYAHGAATVAVMQGWQLGPQVASLGAETSCFVDIRSTTGVGYTQPGNVSWQPRCVWRMPSISSRHLQVIVKARCSTPWAGGATGRLRFTARNATAAGAATPTVTLSWAAGSSRTWQTATLDVRFTGTGTGRPGGAAIPQGVEQIELDSSMSAAVADDRNCLEVHEVQIEWVALTSPLAVGKDGAITMLDTNEILPDRPHSTDLGRWQRDSIDALRSRVQQYMAWSSVIGPLAGQATHYLNTLTDALHRVYTRANPYAAVHRDLTYHVLMGDPANVVAQTCYLHTGVGSSSLEDSNATLALTRSAVQGEGWVTGTIPMRLARGKRGDARFAGAPWPIVALDWDTRSTDFAVARHVYSVNIWGR